LRELKAQHEMLDRNTEMVRKKCAKVNAYYVSLETTYEKNLATLRAEIVNLKRQLLAHNNIKQDFQWQVN